jgi:nucleoside-diphosphate-sugar epimerase
MGRASARYDFIGGSVVDLDAMRQAIEQTGATDVIHLASTVNPACVSLHPIEAAEVNVMGS